jgi:glycosyltransferase involved in cell wall biosynthesis
MSSHQNAFKTTPTILQVIPALNNGGVAIETLEIAKAIHKAGGRAIIVSGTPKEAIEEQAIEFRTLPLNTKNPLQLVNNISLLKELILEEKVDILHVRSRAPGWSSYKAARALEIPFVTTYHAAYSSESIFKTFYNSVMARGDRVIAISRFIEGHLLKKYKKFSWFDPSKIRLIERGVDLHYFDPDTVSKERVDHLRETWGIAQGSPLVLLPGRISRNKGHDLMIKALSLMKHGGVTLVFVGSAQDHEPYRDSLLKHAAALDLEGRVKWMPPCPDLPAAYQLADIVVCPSLVPEGFGRVVAEAQAMKKPVVVSNHGAARDVIEEEVTGWATPPGDPISLAQALDKILNFSPARLKEIGEKGRARVKAYYSTDVMGSKTIAVYKEFLEQER